MLTVFKCIFPDGKIFVGKTKMPFKKYIQYTLVRAKNNPTTIFLWALKKQNGKDIKWEEVGSYWNSKEANEVYYNLIKIFKTFDREFGYNYLSKNGTQWGQKSHSMERSSLSRVKTRFKKIMETIENKKLKSRIETLMRDIDIYLEKVKDLKRQS